MAKAKATLKSSQSNAKDYGDSPYEPNSFDGEFDPIYLSARREALWIILIFLVFASVSLTTSLLLGWNTIGLQQATGTSRLAENASNYVIGMPAWVFYGIFVPWICAGVVSIWFAFFVIKDGALEDSSTGKDVEQSA